MKVISAPLSIDANVPATFSRSNTAWYWDYAGVLQSAGANVLRFNWDKETHAFEGALIELTSTNLFLNNTAFSSGTQNIGSLGVGQWYVLSFYGIGAVQMSVGVTTVTLTGTVADRRVYLAVLTTGSSITFTRMSGTANYVQFESGLIPSSLIPTAGTAVTRPSDVITGTGVFYNGFTDSTQLYPAGSPYTIGEVVQYGGRLYESVVSQSPGPTPGTDPLAWLDTGPNNITAAFDMRSSTRSVGNNVEEIVCIYTPSNVDAVGVMNMANCDYVQVLLRYNTLTSPVQVYKDASPRNAFLTSASPGRYITVVVNSGTAPYPEIGEIVMGTLADLGEGEYGLQWSLVDYSKVEDDGFGIITFTRGKNVKLLSGATKVLPADYNTVTRLVEDLTATPTVYLGTDVAAYESGSLVFAFMKNARMSIPGPTHSTLSFDLHGLT